MTDEEFDELSKRQLASIKRDMGATMSNAMMRAVDKWRPHITDGSPCWCGAEVTYTDPDTGASVISHREPQ